MKDTTTQKLLSQELQRQKNTLMMIPSENYMSEEVMKAVGSVLGNKYSEGYPHARYYQGNQCVDEIELLAVERAKELFGVPYANVQPYSGSPANSAIYFGLLEQGDTVMGLRLSGGGHLTHGHPDITFSGKYFDSVQFDVKEDGYIDMDSAYQKALEVKPKIISVGTTAYPRNIDWQRWSQIADDSGAILHADISHIAGLIAAKELDTPVSFADVVMFTTHKTLRGPRGAVILVTEKGIRRNASLPKVIDRAVFPGLQGGPHENSIAGIAVALWEAQQESFKDYAKAVISNAQVLSSELIHHGFELVTGGTDNHLMVIDLRNKNMIGNVLAEALEVAGIIVNRNSVPYDDNPPFYPSGIRLGTPALTTRGMGSKEMKDIAKLIADVSSHVEKYSLPENRDDWKDVMKTFRAEVKNLQFFSDVNDTVKKMCEKFPVYAELS
ncbi:serine hydroxymethyltransferase [Candidatus Woesebacteria bacterium]|nr:serine hydroxymethyltransferase [Candidatus Woesebacteria bacterium]